MGTPPAAKAGQVPSVDKDLFAALDNYFSNLPDGWSTIAPTTLNELLKSSAPFQLDLRETNEIAESGFIAGSTNIAIRTVVKSSRGVRQSFASPERREGLKRARPIGECRPG